MSAVRILFAFGLWLAALFAAGPAFAQTQTAYAGGNPAVLSIPVTASVGGRCGFADGAAPGGSYRQADFDRNGLSNDFAFTLNCTGPARVAVVSSNGGMVADGTSGIAAAGYRAKADYDVSLNLVANDGSTASATCAAATLQAAGSCSFRGPSSTAQGLRLASASTNKAGSYVRVRAPAASTGSTPLVAGTYSDTLTITLSVAP